jgi:hydroxypyruvate isomerase
MLRFAANIGGGRIERLFSEYPFLERFDRAAAAGFEAVEFPAPYGEDVRAIRAALTRNGLRQVSSICPGATMPPARSASPTTRGAGSSSATASSERSRSPIS